MRLILNRNMRLICTRDNDRITVRIRKKIMIT